LEDMDSVSEILWQPSSSRIANAHITAFVRQVESRTGQSLPDYNAVHAWSVAQPCVFWECLWDFCGLPPRSPDERTVENRDHMPGARWFPDSRINFASHLLIQRADSPAMVFRSENIVRRVISHAELYGQVADIAAALRSTGVEAGDRVCAFMPNMPETVSAMLASASLGAIWSSCSPDFGVQGVLDRFGQIEPKVLFSADGYFYNGNAHDSLDKLNAIRAGLPSLEKVVVVPLVADQPDVSRITKGVLLEEFLVPADSIEFNKLPFNHPLYIMYSSGTTGVPKAIIHGAGGTLLQHLKEHRLHTDIHPGDRLFYFTTCGWMMWNWLVSGLASGAILGLYDGSPFYPDGNALFDFVSEEKMNIFGTSAKFIDAANKAGIHPTETHDLTDLRSVLSTGSPLMPEGFDYVYQSIKEDVCLSSISGGTDIVSCFVLGNPTLPVRRGEIQCKGLGMQVEVRGDSGEILTPGQKGELTCSNSFPCMPVGFWNDPEGQKYRAAYFDKFPNIWCHGDYVAETENGGMIIYGRSDAVLNPGGVRIGTAEIYRQAEQIDEVIESLVIGQQFEGDVRVVLFVRLREGTVLDSDLADVIRAKIRQNTTPRHVPARIVQVSDIPRTKSGKIVELAVRKVIHGELVKNREALANPEALDLFADLPELKH
jgi:acetoacetyl-CoA synthetase